MLRTVLSFAVLLSVAVPCFAQEVELGSEQVADQKLGADLDAMTMSGTVLMKETYRAGTTTLELYAEPGVDTAALVKAAKIRSNDSPEVIADRVDAVRKRLYPDREMALSASVPRSPAVAPVGLYRYYIYWNRRSGFYAWWNSMAAAVTFLGRVTGTWYAYDCNGCSSWKYRYTVNSGGSYTRALYGGYYRRGFYYKPRYSGSKADIIMYFFY